MGGFRGALTRAHTEHRASLSSPSRLPADIYVKAIGRGQEASLSFSRVLFGETMWGQKEIWAYSQETRVPILGVVPSVPHDDGVGEFNVPQLSLLICEVGTSRGVGLGLPWWSSGYESPHNAGVVGSILGQRTKIPHVTQQLSWHAIMKTQHNPLPPPKRHGFT